MRRGWSDGDIAKLAGGNVLRVMAEVEQAAARLQDRPPAEAVFHPEPKSAAVSHEFP
jgi:membrane dipeptidase